MPKVEIPCEQCGAILARFPSHIKGLKFGTFCDRHCLGKFRTAKLVGEYAANYKSGSRRSRQYIEVEAGWHPGANQKGYISLHRLVYEARAGCFLASDQVVHHKDGNPRNNHWDNLEAMTQAEHAREHLRQDPKTGRLI